MSDTGEGGMNPGMPLEAWNSWRQDAKEAGLIDTTADLGRPSYKRDVEDESPPLPAAVAEEREAA